MRNLSIASTIILLGAFTYACSGSEDSADDGTGSGGTGVAAAPGTGGTTPGAGGTTPGAGGTTPGAGGTTPGTGGGTSNTGCGMTTPATGMPTMIDDFESGDAVLPANDGRAGEWHFGSYANPTGPLAIIEDGAMHLTMSGHEIALAPWKDEEGKRWEQWASADSLLQTWAEPLNCYDASVFTGGIKFRAKGNATDALWLKVGIPGSSPDTGETHHGPTLTLTPEWATYEVPFSSITLPSWSTLAVPFTASAIQSLSFVVRSVQPEGATGVEGETLIEYDIWIDDVEFY